MAALTCSLALSSGIDLYEVCQMLYATCLESSPGNEQGAQDDSPFPQPVVFMLLSQTLSRQPGYCVITNGWLLTFCHWEAHLEWHVAARKKPVWHN